MVYGITKVCLDIETILAISVIKQSFGHRNETLIYPK